MRAVRCWICSKEHNGPCYQPDRPRIMIDPNGPRIRVNLTPRQQEVFAEAAERTQATGTAFVKFKPDGSVESADVSDVLDKKKPKRDRAAYMRGRRAKLKGEVTP